MIIKRRTCDIEALENACRLHVGCVVVWKVGEGWIDACGLRRHEHLFACR